MKPKPTVRWDILIDQRLAVEVSLLLTRGKGKIAYGARTALINHLLSKWVEKQKGKATAGNPLANKRLISSLLNEMHSITRHTEE